MNPFLLALASTLTFSSASILFAHFSRTISPIFMNTIKAVIALVAFGLTAVLLGFVHLPTQSVVFSLLLSGALGLMLGDLFMLKAMAELGASRMLMIFGLQPFLLGVGAYFAFSQKLSPWSFAGVVAMLCCLYTFSLEKYRQTGNWQARGLYHGLIAVSLDAIGVLLTRWSFDHGIIDGIAISPVLVNFLRCFGAVLAFGFYHIAIKKIPLWSTFQKQAPIDKLKLVIGSVGGTYLSLMLYLTAVSKGTLGAISAVTVTGPLFAAMIECIVKKTWPSRYLIVGFTFFVVGFGIFLYAT